MGSKTRVRLSTFSSLQSASLLCVGVQAVVIRVLFPTYTSPISPVKIRNLPLIEHYLYPVSTAPTNNTVRENIKER